MTGETRERTMFRIEPERDPTSRRTSFFIIEADGARHPLLTLEDRAYNNLKSLDIDIEAWLLLAAGVKREE